MQEKEIISGIYCIENITTNKKYIGQSININDRWYKHRNELNNNYHYNHYLQRAWNKYGEYDFKFYILELCDCNKLDEKEIYYIDLYNTMDRNYGYNLRSGGQNGGSTLSDESRQKLSNSIKESYTDELKQIRSKNALEHWANPEIKEKIMGENNGMYGKHHSEESKRKMSENKKGKKSWRRNTTPVFCHELNKLFKDATDASKELSIDSGGILKVCRGERKVCGGFHWEFRNSLEII